MERLPSGAYRATFSAGRNPDGSRKKLTFTAPTVREANDWLATCRKQATEGRLANAGTLTVGAWLDRWLAIAKTKVAPGTHEHYRYQTEKHLRPHLADLRLDRLTTARVQALYADLLAAGHSADAVRKAGVALGVALQAAVKLKVLGHNPARDAEKPAPTHAPADAVRALDADQVGRFLAAAQGDRLYALYVVWFDSGVREGELFALQWGDVDWDGNAIRVVRALEEIRGALRVKDTKTKGSRRRIPLSKFSMDALVDHRKAMAAAGHYAPDGLVFVSAKGKMLRKSNFQRRCFNRVLERAGLPHFRPYDSRHSCATLLLAANEPAKVVAERLGHSTTNLTLNTYSHVLEGMQQQAANKLDAIFRRPAPTSDAPQDATPER